ncbi:uncharacterized protein LOC106013285 [Aplysia californica]|uniref:Uncharacterized protein LOC106013285 n=1 Tax=Aplysia californica TaxID=6500 RepID=A0ABM1AAJ7_APLCA|nr:uncharacterized protein LOC106013285 [Aplysia californica]
MGYDSNSDGVIGNSPVLLVVEDTVTATQVLHLLLREQAELQQEITDLQEKFAEQKDNYTNTVNRLENVNGALEHRLTGLEVQKRRAWPKGLYGLLSPNTGCPNNGDTWGIGQFKIHTESSSTTNLNNVSTVNSIFHPIFGSSNSKLFMYQHFCVKANVGIWSDWPSGTYCINRYNDVCPDAFSHGYIQLDDEDVDRASQVNGIVPDIAVNGSLYRVSYCCRSDSPPGVAISLPTKDPFYLYRYKGVCQKVIGMTVSQQYMYFDTEDHNNGDGYENPIHPDGKADNDVLIELCFYE